MLFILVMDVLNQMFTRAAEVGLLQPLSRRPIQHRISLYADDVAIFLQPNAADINLSLQLLNLFGDASGLRTNVQKSNVLPIHCAEDDLAPIQNLLPCEMLEFPCKYLGLPLTIKKLTKTQVQPIIDKIADQLPGWKADLMTRAGRVVQVQYVLTGILIYVAMARDLPPWVLKAIDKIRRAFMWRGRKEAKGGHCLIAWPKVCRSRELGGLGIADLKALCIALKARWPWLQQSEPNKSWANLPFQVNVNKEIDALISMAVVTEIGNGTNTLFWKDKWINGRRIQDFAPLIFALVPKRRLIRRTVAEALVGEKWTEDIQGEIDVAALSQYLNLWDILHEVELNEEVPDKHVWRFSASGSYLAKSAYDMLFQGAIIFEPYERIWKVLPPPPNVIFSCGLSPTIGVGQRIDWQRGGSLIPTSVFYVIKRRRTFIIFWWAASSLDVFGSPSCCAWDSQHLPLYLLTNLLTIGGEKLMVLPLEI